MKRILLSYFLVSVLTACASHSVTISGQVYPAVDRQQVAVYLGQQPDCDFAVIAHIQVEGGYYKRDSMVTGMRRQAARVGASALEITDIQRIGASEYMGSARALRCTE